MQQAKRWLSKHQISVYGNRNGRTSVIVGRGHRKGAYATDVGESLDTVRDTLYARLHGRRFDSLTEKKQAVKHILSELH